MGQGHYLKVIYGVVLDKATSKKLYEDEDAFEDAYDAAIKAAGRPDMDRSYECKQEYLGISLAANGGMEGHGQKSLDDLIGATALRAVSEAIETGIGPKAIEKAKTQWLKFSGSLAEKGFQLPEPELYLVADYD